jgi:hypothetical protein
MDSPSQKGDKFVINFFIDAPKLAHCNVGLKWFINQNLLNHETALWLTFYFSDDDSCSR